MFGKYLGRPWRWYLGVPVYAFNLGVRPAWTRLQSWRVGHFKAQHQEDRILARMLWGRRGFCVEVGANNGVLGSNTYYFEKAGWRGILIEPDPVVAEQCRRSRSRFRTVQAAVVAPGQPNEVPFHVTDN